MPRRPSCECGYCAKCKHAAYMREWYRRPGNAHRQRESQHASRLRRLDAARAYDRARGFRVYDEHKKRARAEVTWAILRGDLLRQPCEVCGETRVDAHHEDYSKPLEVRWLCRCHHMELHRQVA